jgi:hypothetical protein
LEQLLANMSARRLYRTRASLVYEKKIPKSTTFPFVFFLSLLVGQLFGYFFLPSSLCFGWWVHVLARLLIAWLITIGGLARLAWLKRPGDAVIGISGSVWADRVRFGSPGK